ncbi:MAG: hypothetical protein KTR24_08130 [Saprospiraceae bacterium]|nr:hypothetical protein [Saprospiraceae bacterium]
MPETRKLSTILFADIAGYTSVMQNDETAAIAYLTTFKETLEEKVGKNGGQIVQYFGDGCLLTFDATTAGVQCAIELQIALIDKGIPVRVGMHLGEVVYRDNNIFGDGVNLASRIESLGVSGSVLVSSAIRDQIKNKDEFSLVSMGSHQFKNVGERMDVYAISRDPLVVPLRSQLSGKTEKSKGTPRKFLVAGILLTLLIIAFGSFFMKNRVTKLNDNFKGLNDQRTIAVLPLINLNGTSDLEYFSDGLSQEIIDELAKISSVSVSAFTSTFQYKGATKSQTQIADELDVQYLISGSSRMFSDQNRVKLSIELIDPHSQERIWSRTFDEELDDVPTIQLAVARTVAQSLDIELTVAESNELDSPHTESGEAFKLFLNAKAEINTLSPSGFENGTQYLEEALRLDPNYAQAYTLLAWRYAVGASPDMTPGIKGTRDFVEQVRPLITKALELDPGSSDNYLVRANFKLYSQNKIREAKDDVEKAFSINSWPQIPTNYCICTAVSVYIALDDLAKARETAEMAKKIDPGHALYDWDLGNIGMMSGDFKAAQMHYGISVSKADIPFFNSFLGWSFYHDDQLDEALKYLLKAYQHSPLAARLIVSSLSNVYYKMGDQSNADKYLNELLDRSAKGEANLSLFIAGMSDSVIAPSA